MFDSYFHHVYIGWINGSLGSVCVGMAGLASVWPIGTLGGGGGGRLTGPYQALLTARKVNGPSAPVTPSPTT